MLRKFPNDHQKPYCTYCMTEMSVAGLAVTALDIHAKGQKHSFICPAVRQSKIMFTLPETENEKHEWLNKENSKLQTTIDWLMIIKNLIVLIV